jgi:hypothetical protein
LTNKFIFEKFYSSHGVIPNIKKTVCVDSPWSVAPTVASWGRWARLTVQKPKISKF